MTGLDLASLGGAARPSVVVTADDLQRIGTRVPDFYAGDLFCPPGKTPLYLGQPVALLLFETFDAFDEARLAFRDRDLLRFGDETGPAPLPNYGAWRFTRVAGSTPQSPDIYAPIQEGWISPGFFESSGRPIWKVLPTAAGAEYAKGAAYGEEIRAKLASDDPGVLVLERDFATQSVDPMFLEPECGLAWYDAGRTETSSSSSACSRRSRREAPSPFCSARQTRRFRPDRINAQFAYVGGGFGGRDHTPFPLYVALAAMFFPGRPVRLAHDRYQQFQGGIKAARVQDAVATRGRPGERAG